MKKIFFLPAALALALCAAVKLNTVSALAKTVYALLPEEAGALLETGAEVFARISGDETYIFADSSCTDGLFILPKTFYVKVQSVGELSARVTYCYEDFDYARAVGGFVKTCDLVFVDEPPTGRSFPNIFPEFEGDGTFYKNNRFDSFYTRDDSADVFFYGYYRNESEYAYVMKGGKFGYFSSDVFKKIDIPTHPDPMPSVKLPDDSEQPAPQPAGPLSTDTGKAVFVAVISVIAVSVAYLIFLPRKKRAEPADDEPEYE